MVLPPTVCIMGGHLLGRKALNDQGKVLIHARIALDSGALYANSVSECLHIPASGGQANMPRPSRSQEQREVFLPIIARAFADLGYRHATTAELALRCGVRVNILFRLWASKKAMFIAAVEYVYLLSEKIWNDVLSRKGSKVSGARRLLNYEAQHLGEFGMYRILFAGLSETDDAEIRDALAQTYQRFHRFIEHQIEMHREASTARKSPELNVELLAWAFVGLGTVAHISNELRLMPKSSRQDMLRMMGQALLDGTSE
jgi:AcrR family transcriptional regulator